MKDLQDDTPTDVVEVTGPQLGALFNVWATNMPESFVTIGS